MCRCRGAEVEGCSGADIADIEVLRFNRGYCAGAGAEVHWFRGAEVQVQEGRCTMMCRYSGAEVLKRRC